MPSTVIDGFPWLKIAKIMISSIIMLPRTHLLIETSGCIPSRTQIKVTECIQKNHEFQQITCLPPDLTVGIWGRRQMRPGTSWVEPSMLRAWHWGEVTFMPGKSWPLSSCRAPEWGWSRDAAIALLRNRFTIHGVTLSKTLVSQFLYDREASVDWVESGELYFIPFIYWTFPHKISFGEMIPHEKLYFKKKLHKIVSGSI